MNRYLKFIFIGIFLLVSFLLVSCNEKVYKIVIDKKNPIEYIFKTPKDSLYKTISLKYDFLGLSIMTLKNRNIIPPEIYELLKQENNNKDIFLWSIGKFWKSRIYKNSDGEFFDYDVSFYLHLEKVDENNTKVTVKTIEPEIIIGNELLPSLPHMVRKYKKITVEPSTIEEYEILIEIGKRIGEKDMPQLILTSENSRIEIVKRK